MKPTIVTKGIVLSRRDYQEADRILNVLTPDNGRISVIAKGVRKPKSKLAGGIELFTVNELSILSSKSELKTLISSRMQTNYGNIIKDIKRTMFGYELLKQLNHYVEDEAGKEYYELLWATLEGLDDTDIELQAVDLWFTMQMLLITGHAPNLTTATDGQTLDHSEKYIFEFENAAFRQHSAGTYTANHIKLLRVAYTADSPAVFKRVKNADKFLSDSLNLSKNLLREHISN